VFAYITPDRDDQEHAKGLDALQDLVEKMQRSSEDVVIQSRTSERKATVLQCAREIIVKRTAMYEAGLAAKSITGGQGAADSNIRVTEWVRTLESLRRDQHMMPTIGSNALEDDVGIIVRSPTSPQQKREAPNELWVDADNDLDIDLAKAALDTGTKAFEAQEWEEADSLLQEALRVLQQLPKQQRSFCDLFGLHYRLAVCAYYTQKPVDGRDALISLIDQPPSSDEQCGYIYDATHLLSLVYIQMGQLGHARSECEKALQARRRLLGKQNDASLESMALMAHVYTLLDNRPRAKSCLAMIPDARRDTVVKSIERSLAAKIDYPGSSSASILSQAIPEDSEPAGNRFHGSLSASSLTLHVEDRTYGPVPVVISQSPIAGSRDHQHIPSSGATRQNWGSITTTPRPLAHGKTESRAEEASRVEQSVSTETERARAAYCTDPEVLSAATLSINETSKGTNLSRKEILNKIGCQPKDKIEDAVCNGNHSALVGLLKKETGFWRSRLRKRGRPERVTALHFAALFGEIDMARRLLSSDFDVNEVPHGYSTSLTPLKFAIGARQVDMVVSTYYRPLFITVLTPLQSTLLFCRSLNIILDQVYWK
jgi:tetratricopeptide (TPR) repeat protein